MGGVGSGRVRCRQPLTKVEDRPFIDIRLWKRHGLLSPENVFDWSWSVIKSVSALNITVQASGDGVWLEYWLSGSIKGRDHFNYQIRVLWSECHFGGLRPWFECPDSSCRRRVAILYLDREFVCRRCSGLVYSSQSENSRERALRKALSIRFRLGWPDIPFYGHGEKPKSMHWEKFQRLTSKHDELLSVWRAG